LGLSEFSIFSSAIMVNDCIVLFLMINMDTYRSFSTDFNTAYSTR
jgi:hypothetical protein